MTEGRTDGQTKWSPCTLYYLFFQRWHKNSEILCSKLTAGTTRHLINQQSSHHVLFKVIVYCPCQRTRQRNALLTSSTACPSPITFHTSWHFVQRIDTSTTWTKFTYIIHVCVVNIFCYIRYVSKQLSKLSKWQWISIKTVKQLLLYIFLCMNGVLLYQIWDIHTMIVHEQYSGYHGQKVKVTLTQRPWTGTPRWRSGCRCFLRWT